MMYEPLLKNTMRHLLGPVGDTRSTLSNREVFRRIMGSVRLADFQAENRATDVSQYYQDREFYLRFIRALATPLQSALVARLFLTNGSLSGKVEAEVSSRTLWFSQTAKLDGERDFLWSRCDKTLKDDITLALGRDPVMPWPWDAGRLNDSFACIGEGRPKGPWQQGEQSYTVILPVRIGFISGGGNHSTATGIVMAEGEIRTKEVYDFAAIYPHVHTDGRHYLRSSDNKVIEPVRNPVFAAIFEIGRLIHQLEISGQETLPERKEHEI